MTSSYLLDTNAYYLFFQAPKSQSLSNLEAKIRQGDGLSFYISEITSIEFTVFWVNIAVVFHHKNHCV